MSDYTIKDEEFEVQDGEKYALVTCTIEASYYKEKENPRADNPDDYHGYTEAEFGSISDLKILENNENIPIEKIELLIEDKIDDEKLIDIIENHIEKKSNQSKTRRKFCR